MIVFAKEEGKFIENSGYEKIFEFAKNLGIWISPKLIYPVEFPPGYLGLQTTEEILPGEEIFSIPMEAGVSIKHTNDPELQQIYDSHPEIFALPNTKHEFYRVVVFVVREQSKGVNSFWYDFFRFEPKEIDLVEDWNSEELSELQDKDFEYDAIRRKHINDETKLLIANVIQKYPELFKQEFRNIETVEWAWRWFQTRAYRKLVDNVPFSFAVPVADMFNHTLCNTNYYYGHKDLPSIDSNQESIDEDYNDKDDLYIEDPKNLELGFMKLWYLTLGHLEKTSNEKNQIVDELFLQARAKDSKEFLKSKF